MRLVGGVLYHTIRTRPELETRASEVNSGRPSATAVPAISRSNGSRSDGNARASETCAISSGTMRSAGTVASRSHHSSKGTPSAIRPRSASRLTSKRQTVGTTSCVRPALACRRWRRASEPRPRSVPPRKATSGAVSMTIAARSATAPRPRLPRAATIEATRKLSAKASHRSLQLIEAAMKLYGAANSCEHVGPPAHRQVGCGLGRDARHRSAAPGEDDGPTGSTDLIREATEVAPCVDDGDGSLHVYHRTVHFGRWRSKPPS